MKYLKTDADIMQALFIDKHDVDESMTGEETKTLTLIDGNICHKDTGERTIVNNRVCNYSIHVEPKWYEGLSPEKPMLVRGNDSHKIYEVIGNREGSAKVTGIADSYSPLIDCITPLTRKEIQVFMDNAPE